MRNLLILFLLSTSSFYGQSWKYNAGGNAFDGNYKTSYVVGKGTDFPYDEPTLVINQFKEETINFYISGAGYFAHSKDLEILFVFSNELKIFYEAVSPTISEDGKIIFLGYFRNLKTKELLTNVEFILLLKKGNELNVRVKDHNSKNDVVFGLSGSAKAINFVVPKKLFEYQLLIVKKAKQKLVEEKRIEKIKVEQRKDYVKNIDSMFVKYQLTRDESIRLTNKIIEFADKNNYDILDVSFIEIERTIYSEFSFKLKLFNGSKLLHQYYVKVQTLTDRFNDEAHQEKIKKDKDKNKRLLDSINHLKEKESNSIVLIEERLRNFPFTGDQIKRIIKRLNTSSISNNYRLYQVDSLTVFKALENSIYPSMNIYDSNYNLLDLIRSLDAVLPKKYFKSMEVGKMY